MITSQTSYCPMLYLVLAAAIMFELLAMSKNSIRNSAIHVLYTLVYYKELMLGAYLNR